MNVHKETSIKDVYYQFLQRYLPTPKLNSLQVIIRNVPIKHQALKLWIRRSEYLFGMPTKNDVFFSAASCKKDIIFGGHTKQIYGPSNFVRGTKVLKPTSVISMTLHILIRLQFRYLKLSTQRLSPIPLKWAVGGAEFGLH